MTDVLSAARRQPALDRLDRRARAALSARLVGAAAVAATLMAAVYLVLVRTSLGQRFDDAGLDGSYQQLPQTRLHDITSLQRITTDSFLLVLAVIAVIGLLRRRPRLGLTMAATAGLTVLMTDLLKHHVLTRPALLVNSPLSENTFPSGHTAAALSVAVALVVVAPARLRGLAAVVAGSYGWVTAAQVQTAGWHRLSDALGAALFSFVLVCLACALLGQWRPVRRTPVSHRFAAAVLGAVWVVFAALGLRQTVRVLRYLDGHPVGASVSQAINGDAYHLSVDLTIVVVVTLLGVLLALLRGYELDVPRLSWPGSRAAAAGADTDGGAAPAAGAG